MVSEDVTPARAVPWKGLAVATAVAAVSALLLNLGLGYALGVPEDALVDADAPLLAEAGASGEGSVADEADPAVADAADGADGAARAAARSPSRRLSQSAYSQAILGRNLFDSSAIGKEVECEGPACDGPVEPTMNATLLGTIVAEPATFSAAFIQEDGKTSAIAYAVGSELQGRKLVEILSDRVRFQRGTQDEWLVLGEKSSRGGSASAVPEPGSSDGAATTEGIECAGEGRCDIDRSLWDAKMGDLGSLAREARALLHRGPDGNYDGYRLSAIRRGSLPDQLGIKNGDIIHSVNGQDIDSVDAAMRAFDAMRSDSGFKIEVTRRGQPVTLEYSIR